MPQRIILIRHGETDYNKERRMQGWLNVPLNKTGLSQALASADKLKDLKIDALYSSDLQRAHQTAEKIAKVTKQKIIQTPALRERDMGIFSGWQWEHEQDPVKQSLWEEFESARDNNDLDWNKHQGESMRTMSNRIRSFKQHLHLSHSSQTVVVVTHGGTINRFLEEFDLKSASEGFRQISNASILILHKESITYRLEEL